MINFTKMVGSGNDFVIVDNREKIVKNITELAKELCNRIEGIGGDGLILIEPSKVADFTMRIINADGSEAEMCGNGARCAAYFAFVKKIAPQKMTFETLAGKIGGFVDGEMVKVKMIDPHSVREVQENLCQIDTGVPHAVLFVDEIEAVDVQNQGRELRYAEIFKPKGTNVNFVKVLNEHEICVRTYERGVEGETLSCGSGSTASALFSALKKGCKSPVKVHTRGGEILNIYFDENLKNVYLEGKVRLVFEGKI